MDNRQILLLSMQVQADVVYPVCQASQHPVMENFRVQSYRQALMSHDPEACIILGELMFQVQYILCHSNSKAERGVRSACCPERGRNKAKASLDLSSKPNIAIMQLRSSCFCNTLI